MTLLKIKSVQQGKMDYNNQNGKDLSQMFIENETLPVSSTSSRRPSNDSIKSINLPLDHHTLIRKLTPHPHPNTPNVDFCENTTKTRSKSLVNIPRRTRSPCKDSLDNIEESPKYSAYRRGSWQHENVEKPKSSKVLSIKDAFGAHLDNEEQMALPGTPLPSLVPNFEGDEVSTTTEAPPPTPPAEKTQNLNPDSLFFRDGRRKIDMVLVYEEEELGVMTEAEAKRRDHRKVFQENLVKEGLELELEHKDLSFDGKTWFLKIHLPWKTTTRYAALMGLKLPVKRFITISVKAWDDKKDQNKGLTVGQRWQKSWKELFEYDHDLIPKEPSFYDATEGRDREEQFVVKDRATNYSSAQRSLIVMQILLRAKFDDTDKVGIRRLINNSTFLSCFPLHEGRWDQVESDGSVLHRRLLYLEWANFGKMIKRQPLNLIRKYFGDKIGLYFCWLGFYTKMLISPAIVGTLCFMYGLFTMDGPDNTATHEICDPKGSGNITLCPLCDKACSYTKLVDSCKFAKLTYLFDNPATVFFSIFMSLWATVFLELWRRKQSVIQWEWDLQGTEQDEEPRPEFETSVKTFRTNPVTREKEPYLPTSQKVLRMVITGSAVFFMLFVVLGAVLGTIIYRLSLVTIIYGSQNFFLKNHAKIVTSVSAAVINLIFIMSLTRGYHTLAIYLTNLESPRTTTEYEDSYTFKIFLFEFINFYSSLIYIAFFKGRFFDYPGDITSRKSEFFRVKGDICDPVGCLSELCIQLAIIMIGKQILNNFVEIINPKFYNWWRYRSHRSNTKDLTRKHTRWEEDYHLQDPGRLALFDEYLEMILQYGFITLFVAAFPLAPLCALLNNIAEIRLDAYKIVTQARRPLAERVEDIGAWYGILRAITYAAIVSNAFVIAYTSDFIPRMVYKYKYSTNENLVGYIDSSLSVFNTSHYFENMGPDDATENPEICQYRGYRNGPNETIPYGLSPQYWHVFAARLAFVVIFEHVVFALVGIMQYVIPDVPTELKTQIQREMLLAKEAKFEHGLNKTEYDYDDVMNTIRENDIRNNDSKVGQYSRHRSSKYHAGQVLENARGIRGSWARRISRLSDGLDAHVEVVSRNKKNSITTSTVWENS
ncbi:anoctamin-4 isoform X1 [Euwallacea fornicatus]|uniref:anoctamin-4 isoform X1 n=1 Tax=Euwallacea fornicatus TaxID=995702 RepID=UPI00338ED6F7